mmetsp:Transcript_10200/g.42334  ORF Transcript_10200/g.42334 Transcript_10200/m.42334 type:complete len:240 (+) Transcript_10200:716-1435(+)
MHEGDGCTRGSGHVANGLACPGHLLADHALAVTDAFSGPRASRNAVGPACARRAAQRAQRSHRRPRGRTRRAGRVRCALHSRERCRVQAATRSTAKERAGELLNERRGLSQHRRSQRALRAPRLLSTARCRANLRLVRRQRSRCGHSFATLALVLRLALLCRLARGLGGLLVGLWRGPNLLQEWVFVRERRRQPKRVRGNARAALAQRHEQAPGHAGGHRQPCHAAALDCEHSLARSRR